MAKQTSSPSPRRAAADPLAAWVRECAPRRVVEVRWIGAPLGKAYFEKASSKLVEYVEVELVSAAQAAVSRVPAAKSAGPAGKPAVAGTRIRGAADGALARFARSHRERFDVVVIPEDAPADQVHAAWRQARRLLSPKGVCLFTSHDLDRPPNGAPGVVHALPRDQWRVDYVGASGPAANGSHRTHAAVRRAPFPAGTPDYRGLRVRFLAYMPPTGYWGGRLLALSYAEALATTGADVDFLTDAIPIMHGEFASFSRIRLRQVDFHRLSDHVDPSVDVVVIIPEMGAVTNHGEFLRHAIECRARVAMVNFETPNWFNAVSPFKRRPQGWDGWNIISEYADLILSISGEGGKWAREYFRKVKPGCRFDYCYTAINSVMADKAPAVAPRSNEIVMLTRIAPHKGAATWEPFVHEDFAGYSVLVCLGNGEFPPEQLAEWQRRFGEVGMGFRARGPVIGYEKFLLLKSASLLYFPTRFEGFGMPPLEAAYCLLPVVCTDLPVLREFGQGAFDYADTTDAEDTRRAAREALTTADKLVAEHPRIADIARLESCGRRLGAILSRLL